MFNADLALSVTMTALSTLLSVIMLPVNLIIYAKRVTAVVVKSLDWAALFHSLTTVIGAIACGLICSATWKSHESSYGQESTTLSALFKKYCVLVMIRTLHITFHLLLL